MGISSPKGRKSWRPSTLTGTLSSVTTRALPSVVPEAGLPSAVTVYEVGPRDGLQNESALVPTDVKAVPPDAVMSKTPATGMLRIVLKPGEKLKAILTINGRDFQSEPFELTHAVKHSGFQPCGNVLTTNKGEFAE